MPVRIRQRSSPLYLSRSIATSLQLDDATSLLDFTSRFHWVTALYILRAYRYISPQERGKERDCRDKSQETGSV